MSLNQFKRRTNCPNCGAPILHSYNYNCEYCGTFLVNTDEELKKYNNCEIRNVNVCFQFCYERGSVILTIRGFTSPKFQYLEEIEPDKIITSVSDIGKPVGFNIEIPIYEFRNFTYNQLIEHVIKNLPDVFQRCQSEIINQIIEKTRNGSMIARFFYE